MQRENNQVEVLNTSCVPKCFSCLSKTVDNSISAVYCVCVGAKTKLTLCPGLNGRHEKNPQCPS